MSNELCCFETHVGCHSLPFFCWQSLWQMYLASSINRNRASHCCEYPRCSQYEIMVLISKQQFLDSFNSWGKNLITRNKKLSNFPWYLEQSYTELSLVLACLYRWNQIQCGPESQPRAAVPCEAEKASGLVTLGPKASGMLLRIQHLPRPGHDLKACPQNGL